MSVMHRAVTAGQPLSENHYTSYFIGEISTDFMYMNNSGSNALSNHSNVHKELRTNFHENASCKQHLSLY